MWRILYCPACHKYAVEYKERGGKFYCEETVDPIPFCNNFGAIRGDDGDLHKYCSDEDHSIRPQRCGYLIK